MGIIQHQNTINHKEVQSVKILAATAVLWHGDIGMQDKPFLQFRECVCVFESLINSNISVTGEYSWQNLQSIIHRAKHGRKIPVDKYHSNFPVNYR